MFLVTHAAVGAIIGETIGSPILAIIGGFVSHFLFDLIPHGDTNLYRKNSFGRRSKQAKAYVTVDAIAAILFVLLLFNFRDFIHPFNVSLGIVFGLLPDLLVGLYETGKARQLKKIHKIHFFFHDFVIRRRGDISFRYGFLLQLIILILLQVRVF